MPKIVQFNLPPGGTVVELADNNATALDIESVDGDFLTIDTTDSNERVLVASGAPTTFRAGFGTATPDKRFHFHAETGGGSEDVMRITSKTEASKFVLWQCEGQSNRGVTRIFNGSLPCHIFDSEGIAYGGVIINEQGFSTCDFRVESDSNTHMLFVDASADKVGINVDSPAYALDVDGAAGLTAGTAWTDTSDSRIKKEVETIENALDAINLLRPVSFRYTDDYLRTRPGLDSERRYNSFIAQEYGEVFPDAVSSRGDLTEVVTEAVKADPDNGIDAVEEVRNTLLTDVQQYTPHDLHMYLVRAVQELTARVVELEAGD